MASFSTKKQNINKLRFPVLIASTNKQAFNVIVFSHSRESQPRVVHLREDGTEEVLSVSLFRNESNAVLRSKLRLRKGEEHPCLRLL